MPEHTPPGPAHPGLYLSHPACLEHDPRAHMPEHPDTPERLQEIERALAARDWLGWERRTAPPAEEAQLELVHSTRHIERIRELSLAGGGAIDADTFVGEPSYRAALHAAGGACEMTRALMAGESALGFCGVRPSGHHAEPDRAMGFCLFNNVALAAALAIAELGAQRVFVLDWDVHHGNGTAEIFRRRTDVLFASIHQMPLFPGTGAIGESGEFNTVVNAPLRAGDGGEAFRAAFENRILPRLRDFKPELIVISAGFDAHMRDPLANLNLVEADFVWATQKIMDVADQCAEGRVVSLLEGGYDLEALASSAAAHVTTLMRG